MVTCISRQKSLIELNLLSDNTWNYRNPFIIFFDEMYV